MSNTKKPENGPKILTIDIESSPNLAYVWGMFKQNVSLPQLLETQEVISFAAKWHHKKSVEFRSVYHDGKAKMIDDAHALMCDADVLVHYNGKGYDIPHLHREFVLAGLDAPAPHRDVDLMWVARKRFRFSSNKLDHVAQQLGVGSKVSHTGFQLWRDALLGDEETKAKAWALMKRYNMGDVRITEKVYDRLIGWINGHPHVGLWTGLEDSCGRCGSERLRREGKTYLQVGVYQRYQCKDCGGYSRGKKMLASVDARPVI